MRADACGCAGSRPLGARQLPSLEIRERWFRRTHGFSLRHFLRPVPLGFVAFSPLLELPVNRGALGVVAVSPLVWAALRCSQRATAACTANFVGVCSLGRLGRAWPHSDRLPMESFLISTIFLISASVLGLMLSAEIAQRERVKVEASFPGTKSPDAVEPCRRGSGSNR